MATGWRQRPALWRVPGIAWSMPARVEQACRGSDSNAQMNRGTLVILGTALALLPLGCVRTSLEAGENHPANPNAATTPNAETPPTLRPGFDPNGEEPGEESREAPDHQHQHHHHDPGHHHHDPGPADGGAG